MTGRLAPRGWGMSRSRSGMARMERRMLKPGDEDCHEYSYPAQARCTPDLHMMLVTRMMLKLQGERIACIVRSTQPTAPRLLPSRPQLKKPPESTNHPPPPPSAPHLQQPSASPSAPPPTPRPNSPPNCYSASPSHCPCHFPSPVQD